MQPDMTLENIVVPGMRMYLTMLRMCCRQSMFGYQRLSRLHNSYLDMHCIFEMWKLWLGRLYNVQKRRMGLWGST